MAGSKSRSGKQHQASVAKDIVVAVDNLYRVLRVEGNSVLSAPSPFVLDSLHQNHRAGEHFDVPRVIRIAMRHGHQLYVRRLDMYLFELSRERYRFAPDWPSTWTPLVKHYFMFRQFRYGVIDARVPKEPPLGVVDEVAVTRETYGHADVVARRPARFVSRTAVAAVNHIET